MVVGGCPERLLSDEERSRLRFGDVWDMAGVMKVLRRKGGIRMWRSYLRHEAECHKKVEEVFD